LPPGFDAILDVPVAFPAIGALERVTLRVTCTDADAEFWAVVSVTDNDTQTVSIITAQ
jgi:hypothetical protein